MTTLNTLHHCSYKIQLHLVACTKYRRKVITAEMRDRLGEIFGDTLRKWEGELLEFNGEADHVHALISINPKTQPSKLVNNLKTVSSRLIRKEYPEQVAQFYQDKPVFWSRSYCVISCGGSPISVLKQYIQQQEAID
ncbi:IS200/IS605 family transposase [filamentous cyanobacterium LEGE 11480]|uniref:IS200/IS605 family transposase n=1 Tax=Romeriopsis navalis LEGE 11480 TaxID=2777977 RepID=A0A928VPC6_9CYAN|nr:IS200/IS605 family transposase [Romeriopsis navalis]MBE9031358.1 IS200/IS605 family transposase [Romeriopsis navalis LEGE 11480]